ncbi:hypothetical protein [Actinoalloteichus spitiensis]|uniref:hypothetical protein n=1 Tax=Actinoalloteichus spitiensis TaxID=252394 RepID=UPI000474BF4D|nr:hypothetical protein [Actinoalloteichus spitiensis]
MQTHLRRGVQQCVERATASTWPSFISTIWSARSRTAGRWDTARQVTGSAKTRRHSSRSISTSRALDRSAITSSEASLATIRAPGRPLDLPARQPHPPHTDLGGETVVQPFQVPLHHGRVGRPLRATLR